MKPIVAVPVILFALGGCVPSGPSHVTVRVSAASSLTDALQDAQADYQKSHVGTTIEFNFGASGQLQAQIEQGAPTDLFVSASSKEMNALSAQGLLLESSRVIVTSNMLVLITPPNRHQKGWADLATSAVHRVAIANPESVPAGRYAKETLVHRNLWSAVSPKAVYGENVRQVLTYVQSGDVDAGIVFRSDVSPTDTRVQVVDRATSGVDHTLIEYPMALLKSAKDQAAATEFAHFLSSHEGQAILRRHGFTPPPNDPALH